MELMNWCHATTMHPEYPDLEPRYRLNWKESIDIPVQPLSPEWKFPMFDAQLEGPDLERLNRDLKEVVMRHREKIMEYTKPSKKAKTKQPEITLTGTFEDWNFFYIDHPAVECLFYYFKEAEQKFARALNMDPGMQTNILCWPNALEHNGTMREHSHQGPVEATYMSGNYCVNADQDTATVFDVPGFNEHLIEVRNRPGQLTLFPQWVSHFTTPFERDENDHRVTIAADIDIGHHDRLNYSEKFDERIHYVPLDQPPHEKARRRKQRVTEMPGVDPEVVQFIDTPLEDIREHNLVFDFEGH